MLRFIRFCLIFTIVACVAAAVALAAADAAKVKRVPARSTASVDGKDLFREYCAVCHGANGTGGGPAASALTWPPADLTALAGKNGGKFPELRVRQSISEENASISAHGSAEMPVWGPILRSVGPNEKIGAVRIYNLVKYIESIQQK
jgi:mono/diheme cytochrome c family protein